MVNIKGEVSGSRHVKKYSTTLLLRDTIKQNKEYLPPSTRNGISKCQWKKLARGGERELYMAEK